MIMGGGDGVALLRYHHAFLLAQKIREIKG